MWPVTQNIDPKHVPEEELLKPKLCSFNANSTPILDANNVRSYDCFMRVSARVIKMLENKSFTKDYEPTPSSLEKAEKYWISVSMKFTREKLESGHLDSLRPKIENDVVVCQPELTKV